MLFFVTFILFLTLPLLAQDITLSTNSQGQIFIRSQTCASLQKQKKALCEWKNKTEIPQAAPVSTNCKLLAPNKYQLNVTSCVPKFALEEHGRKLFNDGANCWGTAMSFHKLSSRPRYMWPEEMMYWLDSPLCRKLQKDENKAPGDVVSVYAPEYLQEGEYQEKDPGINFWTILYPGRTNMLVSYEVGYTGYQRLVHSVTYVSEELAFGKDSPAKEDRFYFHPMEEVYGRPRKNLKICQENQSLSPHIREYANTPKDVFNDANCNYFSSAHRCGSFETYFEEHAQSQEEKDIWASIESLQDIRKNLFPLITQPNKVLSSQQIKLYLSLSDIMAKTAESELQKMGMSKTKEMLLVHQYFTASAIRKSLSLANLAEE